jgi:solute carrier family 45 protein 1/2/4
MAHQPVASDIEAEQFASHGDTSQTSSHTDTTRSTSHNSAAVHAIPTQTKNVQFGRASSLEIRQGDGVNDEQSPLLPARTSDDVGAVPHLPSVMSPGSSSGEDGWNIDTGRREPSKSSWYLFLLTISFAG